MPITTLLKKQLTNLEGIMFDRLIELLNRLGYQPIFLAETNVDPVEVYNFTNDRRLIRRGPFSDYYNNWNHTPTSGKKPDIKHTETSSKKMSGATEFLKSALQAIGVQGNLELDLSFAKGSDLRFSFEDVSYKRIDPSIIDQVIESIDFNGVPDSYLQAGRLHLVYEYLYASKLLMRKSDHSKFDSSAEAALESLVDANVNASIDSAKMTEIRFEGNQPAAFAYKAGSLEKTSSGRWYFYPEEIVFRNLEKEDRVKSRRREIFPTHSVAFSEEVGRVLPFLSPNIVPERRPYLPVEGMILSVESE